jgi:hypothetical protein
MKWASPKECAQLLIEPESVVTTCFLSLARRHVFGVNFFKHFADTDISVLYGIHETAAAQGGPRNDYHKQCESLHNSATSTQSLSCLPFHATGLMGLHCVRCDSSNTTNSSIDCARIERLQDTHFDSKKNISFCNTGFRMKSDSSNSILQSF